MRLLHTMIRVGDLDRSINFYTEVLGMKLLRKVDNPEYKYTLAFIGYEEESDGTVIELTYNWGQSSYDLGNAFGHFAIGVTDIAKSCEDVKAKGGTVTREPGPVKGGTTVIAFIKDPDGYSVELIQEDSFNETF